jgi:addiction module RelE/StbE family toxin
MKVRFNRGALSDIDEIIGYISEKNPRAAAELAERFKYAAKLIGAMPEIGSRTSRTNFRQLVVGNYLVVYEFIHGEVLIHYVRHGARRRRWEEP